MKTNNFITTIFTLSLVLFISSASVANSYSKLTLEGIKSNDKNQPTSVNNSNCEPASSVAAEKEFSYLRFDVNNYNSETEIAEMPVKSLNYLRFDVNNFRDGNESEIKELPSANEFEYLRFDVTRFTE